MAVNTLTQSKGFLNCSLGATNYQPVHQLNKIVSLILCWRSLHWEFSFQTQSSVSFTIILACMTMSMHSQTTNMTGYLPTSDKSRPRSILGARTRILGIVSISSAHTQGLQGRQSQATHQCYTHHSNTTCTLPMHQDWNKALYWDLFWM
jgi:hypothetical protein